jgi:hypothetical protein
VLHALQATITLMPDFGRYRAAHPGGPGRRAGGSGGGRRSARAPPTAQKLPVSVLCTAHSLAGAQGLEEAVLHGACAVLVRCRARERDATPLSPGGR